MQADRSPNPGGVFESAIPAVDRNDDWEVREVDASSRSSFPVGLAVALVGLPT